jgi:hypothetical protein
MTFIFYELPYHMNIKEFRMTKSYDLDLVVWIPNMNDPSFADKDDAAARVAGELIAESEDNLYYHYAGMTKLYTITNDRDVISFACEFEECETYAPKRVILSAKAGESFNCGGFEILGEVMTCPATETMCFHNNLEALTGDISDIEFDVLGSTVESEPFLFSDSLTD